MQKYFRTRENRNFSTVKSTEQRIFNFSLVEVLMMAGMAAVQVLVVRFFFQGARKGESMTVLGAEARANGQRLRVNMKYFMIPVCDSRKPRFMRFMRFIAAGHHFLSQD